LLTPSI